MTQEQINRKTKEKKPVVSQAEALKNIPRFCKLTWEIAPGLTLLNIGLRCIQAILPVSILYVGKEIIDEVVQLSKVGASSELFWNSDKLLFWIIAGLSLAIFMNILSRATSLTNRLLGDWIIKENSVTLMIQAAMLELKHFEDPDFYDSLTRARNKSGTRADLISRILEQIQSFITLGALIAALAFFSPTLLIFLIIIVIPTFFAESYFNKKDYNLSRRMTPERREINYLRMIAMRDRIAKEVKVFGLEKFITKRFDELATKYFLATQKIAINRSIVGGFFGIMITIAYYSAYIFVLYQTVSGDITIGTMTFLGGAFQRMQNILQSTAHRFSSISAVSLYLQDFFDFIDYSISEKPTGKRKPVPTTFDSEIVFENVSFKYFGSDQYALKNLNFTIKAGERIALVGENGAGKTTLVKLIARLYKPTEGRILWDGVDIQEFDYEAYRSRIGVIFQDFVKFMFTAKENIYVGNIEEKDNQELIETAARKSLADTVIDQLENRYDQMLGKKFAGGVELSGGQWQKIALARAYMRNADVIILDEPTSALDARAEHEVFLRFTKLIEGKSAILISHRFSTVRMAHKIMFLEYGEIKEFGTHEKLIEQNGKYAELFHLQARGYA